MDPLADYNPFYNFEHYIDGQHNGGVYNSGNLNPYIYTYQNPIKYVDPNGKQVIPDLIIGGRKYSAELKQVNVQLHTVVWSQDGFVSYNTGYKSGPNTRLHTSYQPYNTYSGSMEHEFKIFLPGNNDPFTVNSLDVPFSERATSE